MRGRYYRKAPIGVNNGFPIAIFAVAVTLATVARADDPPPHRFELPRAPLDLEPVLGGEAHFSVVAPISRAPLCPDGADCIFNAGVGVGGTIERRWVSGLALGLGYDVWLLDSSGVYELGIMQFVRATARYAFMPMNVVHPFIGVSIGALLFGDTLEVSTVGLEVEALGGIEVELTEAFGLWLAMPVRVLSTAAFVTRRDRVSRASDIGANLALALQAGIVVVDVP